MKGFGGVGRSGMSKMTISPHTERRTHRDSNYFFCPTIAISLAETLVPFVYSGHNKLKQSIFTPTDYFCQIIFKTGQIYNCRGIFGKTASKF